MNILLIVVLAILIIGIIVGWFRGFTNILFETATTLVAIILAIILCGPVAKAIIKNENLMGKLESKVSSALKLDEAANKVPSADELFKNVNLPSVITDKISSGLDEKTQNTAKAAAQATAQFVSRLIIYVACFIVVFIVAIIAIHLLDKFFDLINKLPVVKEVNALVGAAVGFLLALFVVWLFFAVVTLLSSTPFGASMMTQISSSKILNFLYTNNIPMQFITNKVNSLL